MRLDPGPESAPRVHRGPRGGLLWVEPAFEESVLALGLPDPAAIPPLFETPTDAEGRGANAIVPLPGRDERLHLRPLRHGGLLGSWWGDRWLGIGRPRRELFVTRALAERGAPVPSPVLAFGARHGALWRTWLGTVHLEDARDGLAWLASGPSEAATGAGVAAAGRAVRAFHDAGGWHADLHVKNLMLHASEARVTVIDLDRARCQAPPPPARRLRELGRLLRSLHKRGVADRIGERGRTTFFEAYTNGDDALATALCARWPREERRVARHVARY